MSSSNTSFEVAKKKQGVRARPPSASEIARNVRNFETWSTHQGCEQVAYADLPPDLKADVAEIFNVSGKLPLSWVYRNTAEYRLLSRLATREILVFIADAYREMPDLFSEDVEAAELPLLYGQIFTVFAAWSRLKRMRASKEKWSEHDFAANVYNVFRSPALRESTYRVHCTISLPQPIHRSNLGTLAARILNAKTSVPDCAVMIPAAKVQNLSHSAQSPFKTLKSHPVIAGAGSVTRGSSFRFQSTPCAQLPDTPGFEFVSSFWEDKKPVHQLLEDAYRQNRMSTAAAARHLYSLHVKAPILGLIWANGTVRAHVDWCRDDEKGPNVLSAPYTGLDEDESNAIFHEWLLERPSNMLQVHFLIQNIDKWTVGKFRDRVVAGINDFVDGVVNRKEKYEPWRRCGDLGKKVLAEKANKENVTSSAATSAASSSLQMRGKSRRRR